jgi:hypothetical protein
MKELIVKIAVAKVRDILDKTNELDDYPEVKAAIVEAVEEWLRAKLGI